MKLVFSNGPLAGNRYLIDQTVMIGRHDSNDIVLPDPSISLVHCRIHFDNRRAYVQDQGSTNGIFRNGERVLHTEVRDGDELILGQIGARIEIPSAEISTDVRRRQRKEDEETSLEEAEKELSGNIFGAVTYWLKRKVADGGMGAVYEATQFGAEGFTKTVAIKTILPKFARKDEFVSSFVGEARLVSNLVHENIVQIHHLGRHENGYYIAMEYIDGISLTDFMLEHDRQGRSVSPDIASYIAGRICRGLQYAHEKRDAQGTLLRLVHRDVSPNNIMLGIEGEVKLTDFGVAQAAAFMKDDDGVLVGSVEYMSPEQAGFLPVDHRSDIFSLGLVYYELLAGVRVFNKGQDDIDATLERVRKANIPDIRHYRPDVPDGMAAILHVALQKNADNRFPSAEEMAVALEHELYSRGPDTNATALCRYIRRLREDSNPAKPLSFIPPTEPIA